jgi:2,4-dienoyl-CoA reductase (NADPH2)
MDLDRTETRGGNAAFETLLSPLRVGRHVLPNRIMMGSMHMRPEHMDRPLERQAAFYAKRARGGGGLIVTGGFSPNEEGLMEEGGPLLADSAAALTLRPIPQAVHAAGGKFCCRSCIPAVMAGTQPRSAPRPCPPRSTRACRARCPLPTWNAPFSISSDARNSRPIDALRAIDQDTRLAMAI